MTERVNSCIVHKHIADDRGLMFWKLSSATQTLRLSVQIPLRTFSIFIFLLRPCVIQ